MKPFKAGLPAANWLLRISLLIFLVLRYYDDFISINVTSISYFISAIYVIFSGLLFVGGFFLNPTLTVISGFLIFIVSVYNIVISLRGIISFDVIIVYLLPAAIGFYFFARGNSD